MKEINCTICQKPTAYKVLYPENFDVAKINEDIFSARRLPDRIHYRIVKCQECGLIYSNPILEEKKIEHLYKTSKLTYSEQVEDISKIYAHYLKKNLKDIAGYERLLEVGCGSGFFLNKAKELGFKEVYGVEPSQQAVDQASPSIKQNIKVDVFKPGLFPDNYFDVICHFQTFDHLINPAEFLQSGYKMLKPGGVMLGINHNIEAWTAKILGAKCPMIDIEHICLFSPNTVRKIYKQNGFKVIKVFNVWNKYSINYWLKLFPLPAIIRGFLQKLAKITYLGRLKINLSLGNIGIIARKI